MADTPPARGADPRVALLLVAAVGLLGLALDEAASLGLLAGSCALVAAVGVPARHRLRVLGLALTVILTTAWTQGLFYAGVPRTALVAVGPAAVWREGVVHGLVQSLRLAAAGLAGATLALTSPPDRLFAGLVALRVPYGAAFLAVTALRFVPVAANEWWIAREAHNRRGRPVWRRSPPRALRQEMALLGPVVARTLRRARLLAESLEARGFDPVHPRRLRQPLRATWIELAGLGFVYAAVAAAWTAEILLFLATLGLWYRPELRPLYGFARTWL